MTTNSVKAARHSSSQHFSLRADEVKKNSIDSGVGLHIWLDLVIVRLDAVCNWMKRHNHSQDWSCVVRTMQ